MIKFDYVASGVGHSRMLLRSYYDNPSIIEEVKRKISAIQGTHNHSISFLYNAFTEARAGKIFKDTLDGTLKEIYADSGGLQMITLGRDINDQLKREVYDGQMFNSTCAMSFDEIPLVVTSTRSTFHDTKSRYFDPSLVEAKAKESGYNLKEQVRYFKEKGATSRPMMIIQGNDLASYQQWVDIIADILGDDITYLKGVSSGAAALGQGRLEDAKRFWILSKLKWPEGLRKDHLHILGAGSETRFLPLAAMNYHDSSLFENTTISYDSTTHTSGISMGKYSKDITLLALKKFRNKPYFEILNDVNKNMKLLGLDEIEDDKFFEIMCTSAKLWKLDDADQYHVLLGYLVSSIYNFIENMNRLFTDRDFYTRYCVSKGIEIPLRYLGKCRDQQDFDAWASQFKNDIPSKGVASNAGMVTLESFFE